MSIESIQLRIDGIAYALSYDLDQHDIEMLNAELDQLLALLVDLSKVKYE